MLIVKSESASPTTLHCLLRQVMHADSHIQVSERTREEKIIHRIFWRTYFHFGEDLSPQLIHKNTQRVYQHKRYRIITYTTVGSNVIPRKTESSARDG
jgi:uncharacterized tellurite resistance protein B-like protein